MKKFIGYFRDFHKGYFHFRLYAFFFLFVGALIVLNYTFDIEDTHIDRFYGKPIRTLLYFSIHAFAYYGSLLIIWFHDKKKLAFTPLFWVKSLIGLAILGIDRSVFPFLSDWVLEGVPMKTYRYWFKIFFNTYGLATILLALWVMKKIFDRTEDFGIYGLRFKKVEVGAYLIMLLIMVPIVFSATFLSDFLDYYPTYKRTGGAQFAAFYGVGEWVAKLFYEAVYLIDFVNTEVFFRGFLVIGLSKLLGKNVVLPMAATYAVLHFGKPLGETISSVFGGYILGVIALYSRNIWGGVFLHGGIAFLMELFAFLRQGA